jgi:hypothetical protein
MIGFYSDSQNKEYPKDSKWPKGFVPIPVHTVEMGNDYVVGY